MLKNHSILTALILLCTSSFAQSYLPLIEEGKKWNEFGFFWDDLWTDFYIIGNDTIINDSLYHQLFFDSNNPDMSSGLTGYFRETRQGQVYYLPIDKVENLSYSEEYLLYDFNSQPGDTIEVYGFGGGACLITIDSIISVEYYNITRNKYYYDILEGGNQITFYIEGLGSFLGLLNTCRTGDDDWSYLLCVTKDTSLLYFNTEVWTSCEVPYTVLVDEQFTDDIPSIFPNPNDGKFKLEFKKDEDFEFHLYNMYGVLLVKQKVTSNTIIKLNKSIATSGLYIYLILKDNKLVKRDKIIIL